ncbi:hypothetical protein OAK98_02395 [Mariniblastus sp.]|nr:hypothetical protein [Mariniblastus sp.]
MTKENGPPFLYPISICSVALIPWTQVLATDKIKPKSRNITLKTD